MARGNVYLIKIWIRIPTLILSIFDVWWKKKSKGSANYFGFFSFT